LSVLESAAPTGLRGNQRPGLLHLPDGSGAHVEDALFLLGEWGFGYDEGQEFVMASSLREQPDGRWAAKEVGVEEPRQNGKGEIIEGREALGLFYLEERKLIHSAHEFATASEALDRMDDRIGRNPRLKQRVKTVKRSHGEEGVYLKDGRKLLYKTRTKGGGRGFSADLLILDEAMYIAEAFLGALMPVISARPNPQMWYTGSAVDKATMENGIVFARLRQRALEHKPGRMAYFGWSAAYDNGEVLWESPSDVPSAATLDPSAVARGNPALSIRIDLEHVMETEREAMDHRTFCVERLGVGDWPATDEAAEQVIGNEAWAARLDSSAKAGEPLGIALDINPERTWAAIGAADGSRFVKVLEHRPGTGWLVDRAVAIAEKYSVPVFIDERGPAASFIDDLEEAGVRVERVNGQEYAQAWGEFIDSVDQGTMSHDGSPELAAAIKGAVKRPLGDAWAWSRKNSGVDISPLVACTLVLWGVDHRVGGMPLAAFA
jgi:phage terminase large subunit-like protein